MAQSKSKNLLKKINPLNVVFFTQYIAEHFGIKLTLMLSSVYYGLKGFNNFGTIAALLPYSKRVPMTPQAYLTTQGLLYIPWSVKGIFGVCSDVFPIFGYRKRYYMIGICFLATISLLAMVLTPYKAVQAFELLPAVLLFFSSGAASFCDLLCEGKYVEQMKKKPETNHLIVIYVWWCQLVGGFLAFLIVGPMADAFDPRYIFIFFIPIAFQPIIFLLFGCMIDDEVEPHLKNRLDTRILKEKSKYIIMALLTAFGAFGSFFAALTGSSLVQAVYALVISALMCAISLYFLEKLIAKANIYIFLANLLYVNITGPLEYFYTAGEDCVENGPHFDITFFKTYTGIVGQIFGLVGLWMYNTFIAKFKFRTAFCVTVCIRVFISIFDIILTRRWNVALGISDKILYILGNGAIYQTSYMMDFLPATVLMAKICPKEVESTVYSILAGFGNFGSSSASFLGVYLSDLFKIDGLPENQDGTPCNFTNLTWLVVVAHCVLPLSALPCIFILIPDAYPSTDILRENISSKEIDKSEVHTYKNNSKVKSSAT